MKETLVETPSYWGCEHLIERILIPADVLQRRIAELGEQISRDYAGKDLVLVCVLKGGVMFLTDLMRHIHVPHEIDFMAITSYGAGARQSTGIVRILMDLQTNIEGRHVLIVEDIVDSGRTLDHILRLLWTRNPATLRVCALLDKKARREIYVPLDYVGFEIPNVFVFGYGLDLDERFRNLPFVAALKAEALENLEASSPAIMSQEKSEAME
ncbi:hypoxanthine phosphoribosyltransferase [Thermoflexus sp.]|uniref:hypoxanthine phosphoribosyltransferase n=1 Tax=Thermoflexus sp. TaxID=1969742 RepID=UPI00299C8C96|nr:hypoxanthine phosphoribosyltransferase [Thermoflexus sp.]MDW8179474.1 hypoxanthine phosphoribosyltransferase [Anaerolineae bacterium]MDW8186162.1 hypoxanthine phosphoribosyltransferase [Anaerolineae bacterium]